MVNIAPLKKKTTLTKEPPVEKVDIEEVDQHVPGGMIDASQDPAGKVEQLIADKTYFLSIDEGPGVSKRLWITLALAAVAVFAGLIFAAVQSTAKVSQTGGSSGAVSISNPEENTDRFVANEEGVLPNSAENEVQEVFQLDFVRTASATLFFFNKSETFNFNWTTAQPKNYSNLSILISSNPQPDFFAEHTTGQPIADITQNSYNDLIAPERFSDSIYAMLCGFSAEKRTCLQTSNVVQIR